MTYFEQYDPLSPLMVAAQEARMTVFRLRRIVDEHASAERRERAAHALPRAEARLKRRTDALVAAFSSKRGMHDRRRRAAYERRGERV